MTAAAGRSNRLLVLGIALVGALAVIALLTAALAGSHAGVILLDYQPVPPAGYPFVNPFTIQNLMHLFLAAGLGELYLRWQVARRESGFLREGLLPEDYETVLQSHNLPAIRQRVAGRSDGEHGFLPGLVELCILQFQASRSVDQTVSVLNSALGLLSERVELRYSLLRYIVWVIPTIGFIGTVLGRSRSRSPSSTPPTPISAASPPPSAWPSTPPWWRWWRAPCWCCSCTWCRPARSRR